MKKASIKKKHQKNLQKNPYTKYLPLFIFVVLLFATFLIFNQSANYNFLNWDDDIYVTNNPLVTSANWELRDIFLNQVGGNYHPITILSLALNYKISGMNPSSYHYLNLLLHLINIILVFSLIVRFSNGQRLTAFIVAAIFALHPMHIESVVWISERKDVLFTVFFLGAFLSWIEFAQKGKWSYYFITLLLFVFSLLSKPTAVLLPVILLGYSWYKNKFADKSLILSLLPFFLFSIVFGIITLSIQTDIGAAGEIQNSNFLFKLSFASYGLLMYIVKFFVPVQLSAFYPYPALVSGSLPFIYYLSLLIISALTGFVIYFRKRIPQVLIGLFFFVVTISLTLQFISVGNAIMADRYTYIPYIGLAYIFGYYANRWIKNGKSSNNKIRLFLLILVLIAMSALTNNHIPVWKNSSSLWQDVIKKNENVAVAWNNLGLDLKNNGNTQEAFTYFEKAISINSNYAEAYNNKGLVLARLRQFDKAIEAYNRVIEIKPEYYKAFINRGISYMSMGDLDAALSDITAGLIINPAYNLGYLNRAAVYRGINKPDEALSDYNKAIELNPLADISYYLRANFYQSVNNHEMAIEDYSKAIGLNSGNQNYFVQRAKSYNALGKFNLAKQDQDRVGK
ncbi:MAG: tetratricopeptide repeat protein [Prolixibacteraceae bacterium]|jgi:protein O-mannosyl-transferase|nr:tetratricopeptide repeat protein [Prolixibacteraceae bacterium]MBT6007087.1 tetratricopeptide repeat protein [Prolixibacteraceae bacterium]MBT6763732.1 tetratricopeptide repeat protein [Prolixibacteraceae bacterium]MBT6999864.1 tetratricopeptide repeat protein [Prolixibacteraceae bacterium]MBT7396559.1 tetratricopeptide repeat protein [Prolixibacteraceae bacterium]